MTRIETIYSVKAVKEALAYAQTYLPQTEEGNYFYLVLRDLVYDCDKQRPVESDGVHGDLHTESCGCEDK